MSINHRVIFVGRCKQCIENPVIGLLGFDFDRFSSGQCSGRQIDIHSPRYDPEGGVLVRYKVEGRSIGSQKRELLLDVGQKTGLKTFSYQRTKDSKDVKLYTSSLDEPDDYKDAFQIYNAARISNGGSTIVVTNGHHTDNLVDRAYNRTDFFAKPEKHFRSVHQSWGAERDSPKGAKQTSRISGLVFKPSNTKSFTAAVGSIDREDYIHFQQMSSNQLKPGQTLTISTYTGWTPWMDILRSSYKRKQNYRTLDEDISKVWESEKRKTVTERATGKEIPVLVSMAWMYLGSDGMNIVAIKDMYDKDNLPQ